jgi:nucleoside-diphosphate-sugar epimerase
MKVLVTGATGFVASHLVPALAAEGHDVLALGHDASRLPDGAEPVVVDLRRPAQLPYADAVVHLAQANVPFPDGAADLFAVNTAATAALLEHARRAGATSFVFASSASVYGLGERVFREDDAPAASDFYAATKIAAERLVGAYDDLLGTTSLRLVAPYGPGQRNRLVPALIDRVRGGRAITLADGGRPRMNPVYVDDVVRVIRAALDSPVGVVNVGGDEAVTIRELGEAIGAAVGVEPSFEAGGTAAGDLVVENSRFREIVGGALIPLADGLRRTARAEALA